MLEYLSEIYLWGHVYYGTRWNEKGRIGVLSLSLLYFNPSSTLPSFRKVIGEINGKNHFEVCSTIPMCSSA